jgi:hypothetical protein
VTTSTSAEQKAAKPQIIRLTLIKQWYIPADTKSYKLLRKLGVPLTQMHKDFLPTLKLLLQNHDIRAKAVKFHDEILNPFLDEVGQTWLKKHPGLKCTIQARTMVFEGDAESLAVARETVPKLETALRKFFSRWGYRSTFEYSELKGRCKYSVEYWFDPERQPIIVLENEAQDLPKVSLKLGNLRLQFAFDDPKGKVVETRRPNQERPDKHVQVGYVHVTVESKQGGNYTAIQSTRCTYSEVSSVLPLIVALMRVPNVCPNNFEEPAD